MYLHLCQNVAWMMFLDINHVLNASVEDISSINIFHSFLSSDFQDLLENNLDAIICLQVNAIHLRQSSSDFSSIS